MLPALTLEAHMLRTRNRFTCRSIPAMGIIVVLLACAGGVALAAQNRNALKIPDGLAFAEFKDFDTWQTVGVSQTETSIKTILANPPMIAAYRQGIPGNGKPFPEGSKSVKIEWAKKKNPVSPYFVEIPDTLKSLAFMVKDSKRFPENHGWAFAAWENDPATDTLKPEAPLSVTGHECGYSCHTGVAKNDYVFTAYPKR